MSTEAKTEGSRLITEGVLLALLPILAYGVAFQFETGYADCFDYPREFVELGLKRVLTAWTSIVLGILVVALGFFLVGMFLPARTLRILLLNRTALRVIWAFAAFVNSVFHLEVHAGDQVFFWVTLALALVMTGLMATLVVTWRRFYGETDSSLSVLERIEQANKAVADYEKGPESSEPSLLERSLLSKTVKGPLGVPYMLVLLTAVLASTLIGLANLYGHFRASRQTAFWVSSDQPPVVLLRRYGDELVVREITGARGPIRLVTATEGNRKWTARYPRGPFITHIACQ